ncbi:MAG TPA: hypothetical protein VK858_12780 [Longimicrobiales bacterium]|nr:hypothetical protein [Longimicrobiales bacterium]
MTDRIRTLVPPAALFLAASALVVLLLLALVSSTAYAMESARVGPAVLVDLAIGLPILGYVFLVRAGRVHVGILVPLAFTGLAVGWLTVPEAELHLATAARTLAMGLEGGLLVLLVVRVRRIRRYRHEARGTHIYAADEWREALIRGMGSRAGAIIFGELAILWYAVLGWKGSAPSAVDGTSFPGHRLNAYPAVVGALLLVVAVETVAVHLLVGLWLEPLAWGLTALGLYSMVWVVGDLNAARAMPSRVTDRGIVVRTGLRWRAEVPWSDVVAVTRERPAEAGVSTALFGDPSLWLESGAPVRIQGPFGITRTARFVGLAIEDVDGFIARVEARPEPPRSGPRPARS